MSGLLLSRLLAVLAVLAMAGAPVLIGTAAHAAQMDMAEMEPEYCPDAHGAAGGGNETAPADDCFAACMAAHMAVSTEIFLFTGSPPHAFRNGFPPPRQLATRSTGLDPPPPRVS